MVQTVRRPSQVVLLPLAASATAATKKTSVVYRVPIQLEWDKVRTMNVFLAQKFDIYIFYPSLPFMRSALFTSSFSLWFFKVAVINQHKFSVLFTYFYKNLK